MVSEYKNKPIGLFLQVLEQIFRKLSKTSIFPSPSLPLPPMGNQEVVILHLGSNIGDRIGHLDRAVTLIGQHLGSVEQESSYYETEAWGETEQDDFINQAISLQSALSAEEILKGILSVEEQMGRLRLKKWGPRIIDIDLIFYGEMIIESSELSLPHPRLHLRNFVLIPLLELIPDFIHPEFKKSIEELYLECRDESAVILL